MTNPLGQNWLLLRGLTRESAHWGDFIPLFRQAFPDAQLNLLDLPGTGCYFRDDSPATISEITEQLHGYAQENKMIKQPFTVLALSLGAMAAWQWMLRYPEEICAAILVNTSFSDVSPVYQRLRWQSLKTIAALVLARGMDSREQAILRLVSNGRHQDRQIIEDWIKIQRSRPVSHTNSLRQLMAAASFRPGKQKPKQPILLLNSQSDRLVASECSLAIQKKWHLELRQHPWAGHDLTLDDGHWTISQIKDWLAEL